jgi:hypothetical protein
MRVLHLRTHRATPAAIIAPPSDLGRGKDHCQGTPTVTVDLPQVVAVEAMAGRRTRRVVAFPDRATLTKACGPCPPEMQAEG